MSSLIISKIGTGRVKRRKANDGTVIEEEKRPEMEDDEGEDSMIEDLLKNGAKNDQIPPKHSKLIGTRANKKR